MGIRRRRKKLTSLLSNMDRRIRSVEFRRTAYGTIATTSESTSGGEEIGGVEPPGSVYSPTVPFKWTRIKRAYFYPSNVVAGDRFELLYYSSEGIPGEGSSSAEKGDLVSISAVGRTSAPIMRIGKTSANSSDSNPYFTCRAHGTPSWTMSATNTRESLKFNGSQVYVPLPISGDTFGTVTHTYLFSNASTVTGSSIRYSLSTRALITNHVATTTTATLTTSVAHHYQAGDLIDVNDLPEGYRGTDGIFKIKSVGTTSIVYDFDTALSAAISSAAASSGTYVYSVAQKYVRVGSTWFDTADSNKVYYWDGIRYQGDKPSGLSNDGSAPSPPTALNLVTSGYNRPDGTARSRVDLSWTAPTTSANGKALDDLLGYKLRISDTGYSNWRDTRDLTGPDVSETITNLDQNKEYFFRVTAYDIFGNESTGLDGSIVTGVAALALDKLSAPIIPTPRLGVVKVSWDGKTYTGGVVAQSMVNYIEVHASTSSGFTPSTSTLVGKIYKANDPCLVSDLTYNATYYFKFVAYDTNGNATAASDQTSTQIKPLVDTDIIGKVLNGANIKDGSITASDSIIGNTITGGLIQGLAITAGLIDSNAITADKIDAGAVTAVKIDAGAVTASKILATDTFTYSNGLTGIYAEEARLGQNAIPSISGTPGMAVSSGGAVTGWVGAWGAGAFELGVHFTNNYIDMYQSGNTRIDTSIGGMILNGQSNVSLDVGYGAASISSYGPFRVTSGSTAAVRFIDDFGNIGVNVSAKVGGTTGYFRTVLTSGGSARVTLQSDGNITCVSLTQTSSRRFKTDIELYEVSSSILDIPIVKFKYDYDQMGYGYEGLSDPMVGVIAEDLIELGFSDVVLFDEDNPELPNSVDYSKLAVMLIPIVKSLKTEIDELKFKVNQ